MITARGQGRKAKLGKEQEKQVKEWVKEEPKSLKSVQSKIEKEWGIKVSKDTIKRIIKKSKEMSYVMDNMKKVLTVK